MNIKIATPPSDPSKLYMAAVAAGSGAGTPPMYCGGTYKGGWLKGNIRDLAWCTMQLATTRCHNTANLGKSDVSRLPTVRYG
nr:hypothetical protein [Prevotella intermedia]